MIRGNNKMNQRAFARRGGRRETERGVPARERWTAGVLEV